MISVSFLPGAVCSYSNLQQQNKVFIQLPPLISSSERKTRWSLLVVAAARTRQDNRQARHARIRKKVNPNPNYTFSPNLITFNLFAVSFKKIFFCMFRLTKFCLNEVMNGKKLVDTFHL